MKLKLISTVICALSITTTIHAATPGAYIGGGIGHGESGVFIDLFADYHQRDNGGTGAKLFTGFNINKYLGVEGGYVLFPQAKYVYRPFFSDGPSTHKATYDVSALYLMPKAYLPIGECNLFNLFVGLGGAEAFTRFHTPYKTKHNNTFVLAAALGASYQFNSNMTASVEALGMTNQNQHSNVFRVPTANLLSLNLIYNF